MKTHSTSLLIAALLLSLVSPARAQDAKEAWVHRYNGPDDKADDAVAVAVDSAGNVAVFGQSYDTSNRPDHFSNPDYYTAKYAAADGGSSGNGVGF